MRKSLLLFMLFLVGCTSVEKNEWSSDGIVGVWRPSSYKENRKNTYDSVIVIFYENGKMSWNHSSYMEGSWRVKKQHEKKIEYDITIAADSKAGVLFDPENEDSLFFSWGDVSFSLVKDRGL